MTVSAMVAPRLSLNGAPSEGPGNLPSEVNDFVGREGQLLRLRELHHRTRLLTLVGPGGVGKTRLALRLQTELRGTFPDGVWLVDLSPVTDPALVPQAVGDVLGVRQQPGQSWLHELSQALRPRRLLVALDNCEHLIEACAELVDGLLRACPYLSVVATSLQPLGAAAETTWRVPPLSVPAPSAHDVRDLGASEAVRLFVSRVRAHLPEFALAEHNAPLVAEICRRLDGLPLALELVAAQVERLGLAEVAARLADRFALAVGTTRTAPARQRTLQAALDWSWSLLDDEEHRLLRRLGVFVGGWTLAAAEDVCSGASLTADAVANVLGRLVSKSLVVADHEGVTVRYRLLESVRAHALTQLAEAGETDVLQRRHAEYLVALGERSVPEAYDPAHAALLLPESDNVRAALGWSLEQGDVDLRLRLTAATSPIWWFSGHYAEGSSWFERVLAFPSSAATSGVRSTAVAVYGQLLLMLGEYSLAQAVCETGVADADRRDDRHGTAILQFILGNVALQRGDIARAARLHDRSAQGFRELASPGEFISLFQRGLEANEAGDITRVRQLVDRLEMVGRTRQVPHRRVWALHLRALIALDESRPSDATSLLEEALAFWTRAADQRWTVVTLTTLGHARLAQGQTLSALEVFAEAIGRARASGERVRVIRALEGCARCFSTVDPDAAVRLAGAVDAQRQALGAVYWPTERRSLDLWLARARTALGAAGYDAAWTDGRASTLAQALSLTEALIVSMQTGPSPAGGLSRREQQVASLVARGLTNKQIAAELVVSAATVRSHVEHILTKLDLRSRAQIAAWSTQQHLVGADAAAP